MSSGAGPFGAAPALVGRWGGGTLSDGRGVREIGRAVLEVGSADGASKADAAGGADGVGTAGGTKMEAPDEGGAAVASDCAGTGEAGESLERARSIHASPADTATTTSTSHGHTGAVLVDLDAERG